MLTLAIRLSIVATIRNDTDWRAGLPATSEAYASTVCTPSASVSREMDCAFCTGAASSAAEALCTPDPPSAAARETVTGDVYQPARPCVPEIAAVLLGADMSIMTVVVGGAPSRLPALSVARAVMRVVPGVESVNGVL